VVHDLYGAFQRVLEKQDVDGRTQHQDVGLLLVDRDLVPLGPQLIDCLFELFGTNAKDGSPAALFLFDCKQTGRNQAGARGSPIPENDSQPRFVFFFGCLRRSHRSSKVLIDRTAGQVAYQCAAEFGTRAAFEKWAY
jgi:hypothetical protein